MKITKTTISLCFIITAGFLANPAFGQKSSDTLRIGFYDPISMVDATYDPKPETSFLSRAVYDNLLAYDRESGEFKPSLAKSWKRIGAKTIEFKLRDDVKFHDGSEFDADDVVYTLNWMADPKVKFRIKTRYLWIKNVEKIDKYTVRVHSKRPSASALARLALSTPIYPSDVHGALKVKSTFGKKGIGTGPYMVESLDPNKGVILKANPKYIHGGPWRPAAKIGRIHGLPIPDVQTQTAQLLTGGLDMMYRVPKDQLDALKSNPSLSVTVQNGQLFYYMAMDSIGKSNNSALKDKRVRRALMMAVNRDAIRESLISAGKMQKQMNAMCQSWQLGCAFSSAPPSYNPTAAKKLLAEAGFPNGFDVEITTTLPRVIASAVAGDMRKIGVKAKVDKLTFGAYRKKQRQGKIQILVNMWSSGGIPDVSSTATFFHGKGARNYYGDEIIAQTIPKAEAEFNDAKRREVYKALFDRNNSEAYMMPISPVPPTFLHTKDLVIKGGDTETLGISASGMAWK
ncbi:MAG: ABC transporter substrate-binding protein [Rhodospirillales bacterium]|nr:ABC transporter substrate-binding protein [Rhodospirillales bacterium]